MKGHQKRDLFQRALLGSLALTAVAAIGAAPQAEANTGAGAKILNTVTVNYKDAANTVSYSASATTTVTVNLVKAALTPSGRPTGGAAGATAVLPAGDTLDSGATTSYLVALTANANGGDTYNLGVSMTGATNMNSQTVSWETVRTDGTTQIVGGNPATVPLGSSVIQANTANTISIPGGSNVIAQLQLNSAGYKVLVVNGVDYIVTGIALGNAASNTNVGNTLYNTVGTPTAEVLDVITLAANTDGSNTAPAFVANALIGQVAAEQILVKVTVTGVVGATPGVDGLVPFTVTTTDSSTGNPITTAAITTTFRASNLQIKKTVRNCGPSTTDPVGVCGAAAYGPTATGNPGDILEYKVEVINAGASVAKVVSAQDNVPRYTTLISFNGAYGDGGALGTGVGADNFATVYDGSTTVTLTMGVNTEDASVGSGNAAALTANSAMNFYLGNTNNGVTATGGSITNGSTYTILYRMKMN